MKKLLLLLFLLLPLPVFAQQQTALATLPINVNGHYVVLTWTEPAIVDGYNIYRSVYSGGPYTKVNSTLITNQTYTDYTVTAGFTYYYVATAVSGTQESSYSNQASATISSP